MNDCCFSIVAKDCARDELLVRARRKRAAAGFSAFGFLYDEVCERLVERLELIQRPFPRTLILGARTGGMAARLAGRFGIETLVQAESSGAMLARARPACTRPTTCRAPWRKSASL